MDIRFFRPLDGYHQPPRAQLASMLSPHAEPPRLLQIEGADLLATPGAGRLFLRHHRWTVQSMLCGVSKPPQPAVEEI